MSAPLCLGECRPQVSEDGPLILSGKQRLGQLGDKGREGVGLEQQKRGRERGAEWIVNGRGRKD